MGETSTGLKENIAGVLCYVLGWVSGIVFVILEPKNKFIKFHAYQSIVVFGTLSVAHLILDWIPFIGIFFMSVLWGIWFILWVVLMLLASQEKMYKLPWAGNFAEKWAGA